MCGSWVPWRAVLTLSGPRVHSVDTQSRLVAAGQRSLQLGGVPVDVTRVSLRD